MVAAGSRSGAIAARRAGNSDPDAGEEIRVDLGAELGWQCREMRGDSSKAVMVGSGKGQRPGCQGVGIVLLVLGSVERGVCQGGFSHGFQDGHLTPAV